MHYCVMSALFMIARNQTESLSEVILSQPIISDLFVECRLSARWPPTLKAD